ncbi:MAG: response regulator, partial [Myxococcales bacterium]|nr:response regulator [Myxococcales bacterium]
LSIATCRSGGDPDKVRLLVADTGVGMSPELQARIFEPFFTTKELGKGTGLGLSMVHGIVEQSGGRLRVHSQPGVGTRFEISLPAAEAGVEGRAPVAVGSVNRDRARRKQILLLEDDPAVRRIISRRLEIMGYRVLEAGSADEAIAQAQAQPQIDLLLSDIVLVDKSGPWVRDAVVALHPEIVVLFMSGYTDDEVVRRGVREGREHLLQKPFSNEVLALKLQEILG